MSKADVKYADIRLEDCVQDLAAANDELLREWQVRKRCFDRWIAEGRLSTTDAWDRMTRLGAAILALREWSQVPSTGDKTVAQ